MKKLIIILLLMLSVLAWSAAAATRTWLGGNMAWEQPDSNSWDAQYNSGDVAQFLGSGLGTITVEAGGVTPNGITISSGSYIFSGGGLLNSSDALIVSGANCSLVLTNGARFLAGGDTHYVGRASSANTMIVAGGAGTSTFNGGGQEFHVGDPRSVIDMNNKLIIAAGGVLTNVTTLTIAESSEFQTSHCYYNSGVVTDGGKAFLTDLRVGYCDPAGQDTGSSISNTMLIANGGVVRVGKSVFVGVVKLDRSNSSGSQSFNSLTVTNGGQLYSGSATSYIGRVFSTLYGANAKANNNTVTIAGSLNGTNAMWDLAGQALYVGLTDTNTAINNVLKIGTGGVVTNLGSLILGGNNWFSYSSAETQALNCVISGAGGVLKDNTGTLILPATNTYRGSTIVTNGVLLGLVGGSCSNSSFTVSNAPGATATMGVWVTNSQMRWACSNITFKGSGSSPRLKFVFQSQPDHISVPLNVCGDMAFDSVPQVVVDYKLSGWSGTFPLLTVSGSAPGVAPELSGVESGKLRWGGPGMKTLYLEVYDRGTVIVVR